MRIITFTALLILLFGYNSFAQSKITQEEYVVYSRILDKNKILWRETGLHEIYENVERKLNKLPKDLVEDFLGKNEKSYIIENKIEGIRFSDQLDPTWNNFNKEKNEIHFVFVTNQSVSRVGFSKDGKYALVYYGYAEEATPWGVGYIYLLTKNNREWRIKKSIQAWVY